MATDDPSDPSGPATRTVGGFDRGGRVWVLVLFGIGGIALGFLLPLLATWAAKLPWMPFQGPIELLGSFDDTWLVWGRPLIGLALGLALAIWVIADSPVLRIGADRIEVRRRGETQRVIERAKVDSVHRRGSTVVIETPGGRTLFKGDVEGDRGQIRDAFVDLGYPWEGPVD